MENLRILKWSRWSIEREAQVISALIGALMTISIQLLLVVSDQESSETLSRMLLLYARELMKIPAIFISSLFGMDKWHSYNVHMPLAILGFVAATNAAVFALVGTLIGWCLEPRLRKSLGTRYITRW